MRKFYIAPANNDLETEFMCKYISALIPELILLKPNIVNFRDNEMQYNFTESIRGGKIFLVGSLHNLVNEKLMQLGINAAHNGRATEIIPIITYLGYARQDIMDTNRSSLGAKVTIKALEIQKPTSAILVDVHTPHILGYFDIPVDHIDSFYIFKKALIEYVNSLENVKKLSILSPDGGGIKRASWYVKKIKELNLFPHVEIIQRHCNKWREKPNEVAKMELVGDVENSHVICIDDIADTCSTIEKAASVSYEGKALSFASMITHPVMTDPEAQLRISKNKIFNKFFVSNSIPTFIPVKESNIISVDISKVILVVIKAIIEDRGVNYALDSL